MFLIYHNDASTKIEIKKFKTTNVSLIIINGKSYNGLSGDYIDLYNYHILECRSNKFGRFILPGYLDNKPSSDYPYDYILTGYIFKDGSINIAGISYQNIQYSTNETLNWTTFCIRRYK